RVMPDIRVYKDLSESSFLEQDLAGALAPIDGKQGVFRRRDPKLRRTEDCVEDTWLNLGPKKNVSGEIRVEFKFSGLFGDKEVAAAEIALSCMQALSFSPHSDSVN